MTNSNSSKNSGKAGYLELLKNKGFLVPDFIVVSNNIQSEEELLGLIANKKFQKKFYAVRSSVNIEDGMSKSFAGHFYSAIGIEKTNLFKEYKKVLKSYKNEPGKVIIQEFINSTKSGVIFTNDGENNIVINANYGLCTSVVEGAPCDEYLLTRTRKIISDKIESNKIPIVFNGKVLEKSSIKSLSTLSKKEIKLLTNAALKIEKSFGVAQDIEWSFLNKKLYILQARPITRSISVNQELIHYDSANIAESYSGIILPLTTSFATRIYKTVYINLLKASGASKKKIKNNIHIFNNLVQDFYGRIYYNMNNWYLMMSFIPGYSRNKENLEDMITSNIREHIACAVKPSVRLKLGYPLIVIFKMMFFSFSIHKFKRKVHKYLRHFRSLDIHSFSLEKCIEKYNKLNSELLEKWHITVENDFIMMSYLGILKKKIKDTELQSMLNYDNKSAQQILALKDLSKTIYSVPELKEYGININTSGFDQALHKYPDIQAKLESYFMEYGGRFANELKLESSDIEEDKTILLQILNLYSEFEPVKIERKSLKPKSFILKHVLKKFKKYASQREELRLLRSNSFSVVRKLFLQFAKIYHEQDKIENIDDIFYLFEEEIIKHEDQDFKPIVAKRKSEYLKYKTLNPLPYFSLSLNEKPPLKTESYNKNSLIKGRPCSSGIVEGNIRVFKEYYLPEKIDFDILVSKNTDPGWVTLIALSKGLIIEHGGILSHAAIVSRELGIPTIIGVENATEILKDLQTVKLNGSTGQIQILESK